MLPRKDGTIDP